MKFLIRQLLVINKRVLKGRLSLTDDVKQSLPRSLWNVEFPPPRDELLICGRTCKRALRGIDSKRGILIIVIILCGALFGLYTFV
jgi:hypothetical protein